MKRNDQFIDAHGLLITVTRVAKSKAWTDIRVLAPGGATWTKRQPLREGRFAFEVKKVSLGHRADGVTP